MACCLIITSDAFGIGQQRPVTHKSLWSRSHISSQGSIFLFFFRSRVSNGVAGFWRVREFACPSKWVEVSNFYVITHILGIAFRSYCITEPSSRPLSFIIWYVIRRLGYKIKKKREKKECSEYAICCDTVHLPYSWIPYSLNAAR